jgi:hypothetical protein
MSEYVAVSNSTFEIEVTPVVIGSAVIATPNNGVHGPLNPAFFGINDCKKTEDNNCKVNGDKILVDNITEVLPGVPSPPSGGAAADFSCGTNIGESTWVLRGLYIINSSAIKAKCSGLSTILENDSTIINCVCSGTNTAGPPVSFAGSCVIKVSKAGQTKVKAE